MKKKSIFFINFILIIAIGYIINYYLNYFNGGYAISVTFIIPGYNMTGPIVIYINPFTKQIICVQSGID